LEVVIRTLPTSSILNIKHLPLLGALAATRKQTDYEKQQHEINCRPFANQLCAQNGQKSNRRQVGIHLGGLVPTLKEAVGLEAVDVESTAFL
jgi:hypothetical protein